MPDLSSLVILDGGNFTTNQTLLTCSTIFAQSNHLLAEKALVLGLWIGIVVGISVFVTAAKIYGFVQSNEPKV